MALAKVDHDRAHATVLEWLKDMVPTADPLQIQRLFGAWDMNRTAALLRDEGLRRLLVERLVMFLGQQDAAGSAASHILLLMGSSVAVALQYAIRDCEPQTAAGISRVLDEMAPGWHLQRQELATAASSAAGAAFYRAGVEAMLAERNEHALCCMYAAAYADATNIDGWCGCGSVLIKLHRLEEGLAHFERALELDARSWRALVGMGNCLAASDRPAEAVEYYNRVLALQDVDTKGRAYAQFCLALALADLGEWDGARRATDLALELDQQLSKAMPNVLQLRKAILDREPHLYNSGPVHRAKFAAHLDTMSKLSAGSVLQRGVLNELRYSAERLCFDNPQNRGAEAIQRWLGERLEESSGAAARLTQEEIHLVSAVRLLE